MTRSRLFRRMPRPALHLAMLALLTLACLVLAGSSAFRIVEARGTALRNAHAETDNLARSLAQHADDAIQAADTVLIGLRQRVERDPGEIGHPANLHELMALQDEALPLVHGFFVFGAAGQPQVSSVSSGRLATSYGDRPYLQWHRAHADRGPHVSGPFTSRLDGARIMVLSRRVDAPDGSFAGVVLATMAVRFFQDFYGTFEIGNGGIVTLAALDGSVLARRPADPSPVGSNIASSAIFREYLPLGLWGSFEVIGGIDGKVRVGSFHQLARYPLLVLVSRERREVLADWRSQTAGQLAGLAGIVVLIALLGILLARQIRGRQQSEALYRLLADHSSDAIICTSLDGVRRYASPAFLAMTGWSRDELVGRRSTEIIVPEHRAVFLSVLGRLRAGDRQGVCEFRYLRKDGSSFWVESRLQVIGDRSGAASEFVGNLRDITERKRLEGQLLGAISQLRALSATDALTGLANRRHFDEALTREWGRAMRERQPLALLLLDADKFKSYNDTYGHPAGDDVLRAIAETCRGTLRRPADLAVRYGGEEFAVLLPGTDAIGAAIVAEQIREGVLARRIPHAGAALGLVSVSLGVAAGMPGAAGAPQSAVALLRQADQALYDAKRNGRNGVAIARIRAMAS